MTETKGLWNLYGLTVESDYPLPFPPASSGQPDIHVRNHGDFHTHETWLNQGMTMTWSKGESGHTLRYRFRRNSALEFCYPETGGMIAIRHRDIPLRDILLYFLGTGLGAALYLRGLTLLHASGVVMNGRAVLFAGVQGAGKSTFTAFLTAKGHPFLCDDIAPLAMENQEITVAPGCPLLKINRQLTGLFGLNPEDTLPVSSYGKAGLKSWVNVNSLAGGFRDNPVALSHIYILGGRKKGLSKPLIHHMPPSSGGLALARQLYGIRWLGMGMDHVIRMCAQITSSAVIRELWLPDGLETMGLSTDAIVKDVSRTNR